MYQPDQFTEDEISGLKRELCARTRQVYFHAAEDREDDDVLEKFKDDILRISLILLAVREGT